MLYIKMIILTLFLSSFLFFMMNQLYKRTNHNKNFFENAEKFTAGVPKNLEVICTGSSYAKFGIDFQQTVYQGFNFGIFPQSLNYDYKILQQYKKNLKGGCVVLITLAPLVFGFVDYENDTSNYKYYRFLKQKYINNYKLTTKICHIIFPLLATPRLAKYILNDVPRYRYDDNIASEELSMKEANSRMKGWCEQFRIKDLKESTVTEDMKSTFQETSAILHKMIEFCMSNDLSPVIVIPPVSKSLFGLFSAEFLEVYLYNNIMNGCNENIPVLNYLANNKLNDYRYYSNSDFMNSEGREAFTTTLINDLELRNLLNGRYETSEAVK